MSRFSAAIAGCRTQSWRRATPSSCCLTMAARMGSEGAAVNAVDRAAAVAARKNTYRCRMSVRMARILPQTDLHHETHRARLGRMEVDVLHGGPLGREARRVEVVDVAGLLVQQVE